MDLLSGMRLVIETFEHLFKSEPLVAHAVRYRKAAGCRAFHTDRIIRRLLDLHQKTPGSDRMGHTAFDQDGVAGFDRILLHRIKHAGDILLLEQLFPHLPGDVFFEAVVNARSFSVDGPAAENMPAFRFPIGTMKQPHRGRTIRMDLKRQPLCTVDQFGQNP